MKNYLEQIKEYFRTTPEEVLKEEWERIHSEYCFGPEVFQYMEETQRIIQNMPLTSFKGTHIRNEVSNYYNDSDIEYFLAA
jgi:hypothetical protein